MSLLEPTSLALVTLCAIVAVVLPVALVAWLLRSGRLSGARRWWVAAGIVVGLLGTQVLAVAGSAMYLNNQFGFYPTWSSLFAGDDAAPAVGVAAPEPVSVQERDELRTRGWMSPTPDIAATAGQGSYRIYVVTGKHTKVQQRVYVWLPPGYKDPVKGKPGPKYPVITFYGGAYVDLSWVVANLQIGTQASPLIASGKIKPFIAVIPDINIGGRAADTECADAPDYPPAYTWLATDVVHWVSTTFPVGEKGRSWAVAGWSTGGYCAAKVHLREPGVFAAASSFQGYYAPELDSTTGTLARSMLKNPKLRELNSPTWLVQHLQPGQNVNLLVGGTTSDPQSTPQARAFLQAAKGVPGVQADISGTQGHVIDAWRDRMGTILPWLSATID